MDLEATVLRSGLYINKKNVGALEQEIKSKFKITFTNTMKMVISLSVYTEVKVGENVFIVLPIWGGIQFARSHKIKVKNAITLQPQIDIKRSGSPTSNQKLIADHIMDKYFCKKRVDEGTARLIVNLDTGQGKSYLACELVHRLKTTMLVIVPNSTLLMDWYGKVLTKEFPPEKVGLYYGKEKKLGDIMVMVINSAVQSDEFKFVDGKGKNKVETTLKPSEFFKRFDLIVLDESHSYCSKENSKIFWKSAPYVLGLSATPTETAFYKASVWGIGEIVNAADIPGYEVKQFNFQGSVNVIKYSGHPSYIETLINEKTGTTSTSKTLNLVIQDPYRMALAVHEACKLVKDHFVFVFSDRCSLNQKFAELVRAKMPNIRCDVVMGGAKKEQMEDSEKNANMIVSTYGYMSTGKSIPKMTAILKLTPRKSKTRQIDGRITRLGGDDTIVRQITDIVDWKTVFKSQFYSRQSFYKTRGFGITTRDVSYRDLEREEDFKIDDLEEDLEDNLEEEVEEYNNEKSNEIMNLMSSIFTEDDLN